jgi:hypothetical protein
MPRACLAGPPTRRHFSSNSMSQERPTCSRLDGGQGGAVGLPLGRGDGLAVRRGATAPNRRACGRAWGVAAWTSENLGAGHKLGAMRGKWRERASSVREDLGRPGVAWAVGAGGVGWDSTAGREATDPLVRGGRSGERSCPFVWDGRTLPKGVEWKRGRVGRERRRVHESWVGQATGQAHRARHPLRCQWSIVQEIGGWPRAVGSAGTAPPSAPSASSAGGRRGRTTGSEVAGHGATSACPLPCDSNPRNMRWPAVVVVLGVALAPPPGRSGGPANCALRCVPAERKQHRCRPWEPAARESKGQKSM